MKDALNRIVEIGDFVLVPPSSRVDKLLNVAYVVKINPMMLTLQIPGKENQSWRPTSNAYSKQVVIIDEDSTRISGEMCHLRNLFLKNYKPTKNKKIVSSFKLRNLLKHA